MRNTNKQYFITKLLNRPTGLTLFRVFLSAIAMLKCAKTRAYRLPITERPSGSCAVLTGSLAEKECLLCHCDKMSLQRRKKEKTFCISSSQWAELFLDEGKKQEVWKENWAPLQMQGGTWHGSLQSTFDLDIARERNLKLSLFLQ